MKVWAMNQPVIIAAGKNPEASSSTYECMYTSPIKVSVIIPVYNPGPGIDRCICSLQEQTLHEIEMIFIDDRGTDGAMETIQRAAEKDPRIRILTNSENCGPGLSRNAGIEVAQGEYLSFVDPDDYVDPDFLRLLYEKASCEDLDIVKGRHSYVREDGTQTPPSIDLNAKIREKLPMGYPLYYLFSWQHQSALYRRKMVMESGARYGTSRKAQDTTYLLKICHAAHTFALEDNAVYYFCEREGSAMHTFSERILREQLLAFQEQMAYLSSFAEEDLYAAQYAQNQIYYCLKLQAYCSRKPELKTASAVFLSELRKTVMELPFSEEMMRNNMVIRIVVRYGENLCLDPFFLQWRQSTEQDYLEIAERWTEFMCRHPECMKEYRWGLAQAFGKARERCSDHTSLMKKLNELEKKLPTGRMGARYSLVLYMMRFRHAIEAHLPAGMVLQLKKWLNRSRS